MRLEPRLLIWSSTRACAPAPTATIAITAPTPMMMPSIVSARAQLVDAQRRQRDAQRGEEVHAACPRSPRAARRAPRRRRPACCACRTRSCRRGTRCSRDANVAMSCSCVTTTIVMPARLSSCSSAMTSRLVARIERAGRLVGEDQPGVVDQRARDRDALLLAAGELRGMMVRRVPSPTCCERPQRACAALGARARRHRAAAARRCPARCVRGSRLNCWNTKPIERLRMPASASVRQSRHVLAVEPVVARGRHVEAADRRS